MPSGPPSFGDPPLSVPAHEPNGPLPSFAEEELDLELELEPDEDSDRLPAFATAEAEPEPEPLTEPEALTPLPAFSEAEPETGPPDTLPSYSEIDRDAPTPLPSFPRVESGTEPAGTGLPPFHRRASGLPPPSVAPAASSRRTAAADVSGRGLPAFSRTEPQPDALVDMPLSPYSESDTELQTRPGTQPPDSATTAGQDSVRAPSSRASQGRSRRSDAVPQQLPEAGELTERPLSEVPSFEPSPAVADDLFAAGEFERAAFEYEAAARVVPHPAERVGLLARQARALLRLGRAEQAAIVLEHASRYDPSNPDVLEVRAELTNGSQQITALLPSSRDTRVDPRPPPSEPVRYADTTEYEHAVATSSDPGEVRQLCDRLEELAREGTADPARVAAAMERLAELDPDDIGLCDRISDLYAAGRRPELALRHSRRAALLAPMRAASYRRALASFQAMGELDGAWNAATVLDCLGEAEINEALLASQHKPDGLLAARGSVAYGEWRSVLLAGNFDDKIWDVLEALGPAGVRIGAAYARQQKQQSEPDPAFLQDPERSTTMLAKTLGWTARLFGLSPPALYVVPELPGELAVAATEQASVLANRSLASGLGLSQLAFLWGREVPRFRNELRALGWFRTRAELSSLVTAALALGESAAFMRALDPEAKRLYPSLRREVRGTALDRLKSVARTFPAAELGARAERSLRGMEYMGVRAGLIACGDVSLAAELVRNHPVHGLTSRDEQLAELYAFSISEAYVGLRRRIGVAVAA